MNHPIEVSEALSKKLMKYSFTGKAIGLNPEEAHAFLYAVEWCLKSHPVVVQMREALEILKKHGWSDRKLCDLYPDQIRAEEALKAYEEAIK